MSFLDLLFGKPLASHQAAEQKIGPAAGVPIFGLDALGSAAYGPEAALTLLMALGAASDHYVLPISLAIVVLLAIVFTSYRQTIAAYPSGGGSYTVARKNLGTYPGLLAAAALMVDYILVVAVGIAAGVGALVSAVPRLQPHTVLLCLGVLVLITVVNLRGLRETGLAFMAPTYIFIGCMLAVIVVGVVKTWLEGGHPAPVVAPPGMNPATEAVGWWLLLRAFASGCTAMTGVEAVSNGVTAFREPRVKLAQQTLSIVIGILTAMLLGIAYLARVYHIGATLPGRAGYESILSQLTGAVTGKGGFYYATMTMILVVLSLQANTAFAGFPRLCRAVAEHHYLPHSFTTRGRRLVYSQGIYVLAIVSGLLLLLFGGVTDRLIPLFAVGAFLAFTLSQAGMVAHWRRLEGPDTLRCVVVNAVGAVATGVTTLVVIVSKFEEGAWLTLLAIPGLVFLMVKVRRHYQKVGEQIAQAAPLEVDNLCRPLVVVPIERWTRIAQKTLRFGLTLSPDIVALHIDSGEQRGTLPLEEQWGELVEKPTREAGMPVPRLVVLKSPYRLVITPILRYVLELERSNPDRPIAVVVPEIVEKHWYQYFLHQQRGKLLSLALIFKGNQRISIINVPWHLDGKPRAERHSEIRVARETREAA